MRKTDTAALWAFGRIVRAGSLTIRLPDGTSHTLGQGEPHAEMTVNDRSVVFDVFRTGLIGFAEAYMDGRVETTDLPGLVRWGAANHEAWFDHPLARATLPMRKLWQRIRPGRRHPRVKTMNEHYNLGNEFYGTWLDETMTYSSARFQSPTQALADAQRNKYRSMADLVGLRPGMSVLEIGCGWGGFAEYAARERGCDVTAITLSTEQADLARKRIADEGLTDSVDIRIQDFREVDGTFDAVISIEMIESVDESQWPALFETIRDRLSPAGRAAMQIITIDDSEWERYRSRADFIQQYIFPGGQLPAPKVLAGLARSNWLEVEKVERFGLDYARTLAHWRERFETAWPDLAGQNGLDERFRRMWMLYLTLCEAGFRIGRINVEQWCFAPEGSGHEPVPTL